jgi:hypothetical protein
VSAPDTARRTRLLAVGRKLVDDHRQRSRRAATRSTDRRRGREMLDCLDMRQKEYSGHCEQIDKSWT